LAERSRRCSDDISSELKSGLKGGVELRSISVALFLRFICLGRPGDMDVLDFLTAPCRQMPELGGVRARSAGMVEFASEGGSRRVSSEFALPCDCCTLSLVALLSLRRSRMPLLMESLGGGIATAEELDACAGEHSGLTSLGIARLTLALEVSILNGSGLEDRSRPVEVGSEGRLENSDQPAGVGGTGSSRVPR
jgi:hypothetical protein